MDSDSVTINIDIGIIILHRSTTYVNATYCYRPSSVVGQSVCQSVTIVSPTKMAELIEIPFGLRTWVAQGTMY